MYIWTGATPPASPTANVATTTYNATSLTASTLYNWYVSAQEMQVVLQQMRANKTTFITAAAIPVPACVTNTAPANGATHYRANNSALNCGVVATATSYDVYLWTGATPPATPTANVVTTSYNAAGLTASTLYNWYIAPRNAGGAATTCRDFLLIKQHLLRLLPNTCTRFVLLIVPPLMVQLKPHKQQQHTWPSCICCNIV